MFHSMWQSYVGSAIALLIVPLVMRESVVDGMDISIYL